LTRYLNATSMTTLRSFTEFASITANLMELISFLLNY
jgi:hypothetical protein